MGTRIAPLGIVASIVAVLAVPAHAVCPTPTVENVANSFRGAHALCHNLSLQTSVYSAKARMRLKAASTSFHAAEQVFNLANPVKALANAAKGVGQTFAAGQADRVLLFQLAGIRTFMAESVAAYLRCTLDDLVAQHPKETAKAEALYARALAAHQAEDFAAAMRLYRKGFKKVKAFLGA
jgi:hypothetical protein